MLPKGQGKKLQGIYRKIIGKGKLQGKIHDEHRRKDHQQNISKPNLTLHMNNQDHSGMQE